MADISPSSSQSNPDDDFHNEFMELNDYFTKVIDQIPIEHYGFDEETMDLVRERKHALQDSFMPKKGQFPPMKRSWKHKLAGMNSDQLQTVSQVQSWLSKRKKSNPKDQSDTMPRNIKSKKTDKSNEPLTRQEMLDKLHAKLDKFREDRKFLDVVADKERLRTKRRISKLKLKERRKAEKTKGATTTTATTVGTGAALEKGITDDGKRKQKDSHADGSETKSKKVKLSKLELLKQKTAGVPNPPAANDTNSTPGHRKQSNASDVSSEIRNSEGKIVYGKFDLITDGDRSSSKSRKNKPAEKPKTKLAGKDFKKLLQKVEHQTDKLNKLKMVSESAAEDYRTKLAWQAAVDRAQGIKVKDNPELLKRSLKAKTKRKEHSEKKWTVREQSTEARQQKKQDKRKANLGKRKDHKKDKKIEKAKKKGRYVPGF